MGCSSSKDSLVRVCEDPSCSIPPTTRDQQLAFQATGDDNAAESSPEIGASEALLQPSAPAHHGDAEVSVRPSKATQEEAVHSAPAHQCDSELSARSSKAERVPTSSLDLVHPPGAARRKKVSFSSAESPRHLMSEDSPPHAHIVVPQHDHVRFGRWPKRTRSGKVLEVSQHGKTLISPLLVGSAVEKRTSPPGETTRTGTVQDVSQHGKALLQEAFADGRLASALRSEANIAPDLSHAQAANLVPDLGTAKSEAFRRWARARLEESSSQGNLDTVSALLAKLAVPLAPRPQFTTPLASPRVSAEAKAAPAVAQVTRVNSSKSLQLAVAREVPKTVEGRRKHGRNLLVNAYVDGSLEKDARVQSKFVPDTHMANAMEFRRRARHTLLHSQSDGRLEMLIVSLSWSYSDVQPCTAQLNKGWWDCVPTLKSTSGGKGLKKISTSALRRPFSVAWPTWYA